MLLLRIQKHRFVQPRRYYGSFITPGIESYVSKVYGRYQSLNEQLSGTDLAAAEISSIGKQIGEIEKLANAYEEWKNVKSNLKNLQALCAEELDESLKELAYEDIKSEEMRLDCVENRIKDALVAPDPEESGDAVMEIRAGTGGDEAAIFAGEMLQMYEKYCALRQWEFNIVNVSRENGDVVRDAMINIVGEGAFQRLKYESGVHRVQRIPRTDSQGRVHTSTITVALLPQSDDIVIDIAEKDLRVEFTKSSGPGGQHVNKTNSAARVTHLPTGITLVVQEERCAQQNKARAMAMIKAKLYELKRSEQVGKRSLSRDAQIGQAERSDKIRTYNFPQARITDHRLGLTVHGMESFFSGRSLDQFIDQLTLKDEEKRIASLL